MIKENKHIVFLFILFVGMVKVFELINFWQMLNLNPPEGIVFQGALFFVFYFVLKNFLFAPYINIFKEREEATKGKRDKIEILQQESDLLLEKYQHALETARLKAAQERDKLLLEGEALEKATLVSARKTAQDTLSAEKERIAMDANKAQAKLKQDIPKISDDIVARFIRVERTGGILKKAMHKAVS